MSTRFTLNGQEVSVDADPSTPLLWVLRDHLKLTGTKYGCGIAQCGACTVQLAGQPVRSCSLPLDSVADKDITTIETTDNPVVKKLQDVWQELAVYQCGYCQSGQILSAAALLAQNPAPSDRDIDTFMSGNICRCATYGRIRAGIKQAAAELAREVV